MGKMLKLSDIRVDPTIQAREGMNEEVVSEYADRMAESKECGRNPFPPVVCFFDGTEYLLAGGFHRYAAAKKAGLEGIEADIRDGSRREAVLFAVGDNATHGLQRSNADKRKAVETLLSDQEWGKWSDREIARHCTVSPTLVGKVRSSLSTVDSEPRTYTTKHGTDSVMNVARIGHADNSDTSSPPEPPLAATEQAGTTEDAAEPSVGVASIAETSLEPSGSASPPQVQLDAVGQTIPECLLKLFGCVPRYRALVNAINAARREVETLFEEYPPTSTHQSSILSGLNNIKNDIRVSVPYTVCPVCYGSRCKDKGAPCRGTGWLVEDAWGVWEKNHPKAA